MSGLPDYNNPQASPNAIQHPRPLDILCGKDKMCVSHVGSKRFRAVIETYRHRYSQAKTKYQKMTMTKEIYERLINDGCRFLKFNNETNLWEELASMAARDKVGHALRFANRKKRRKTAGSASVSSFEESSASSYLETEQRQGNQPNPPAPAAARAPPPPPPPPPPQASHSMASLPDLENVSPIQFMEQHFIDPNPVPTIQSVHRDSLLNQVNWQDPNRGYETPQASNQTNFYAPNDPLEPSPILSKKNPPHLYQESIGGDVWSMMQEGIADWEMPKTDTPSSLAV